MKYPKLPDGVYDILKWIVVIVLPSANTAIFALGKLLEFDSTIVCGVIGIFTMFLGAAIGVSTVGYNKEKTLNAESEETEHD